MAPFSGKKKQQKIFLHSFLNSDMLYRMGFRAELANVKAITQKKRDGQMTRSCLKFWINSRRMVTMMGLHMMKKETMSRKSVRKSRKSCWDTRSWWLSEYARLNVSLFLEAFVICREHREPELQGHCGRQQGPPVGWFLFCGTEDWSPGGLR